MRYALAFFFRLPSSLWKQSFRVDCLRIAVLVYVERRYESIGVVFVYVAGLAFRASGLGNELDPLMYCCTPPPLRR